MSRPRNGYAMVPDGSWLLGLPLPNGQVQGRLRCVDCDAFHDYPADVTYSGLIIPDGWRIVRSTVGGEKPEPFARCPQCNERLAEERRQGRTT
jgi:hypothetical protein